MAKKPKKPVDLADQARALLEEEDDPKTPLEDDNELDEELETDEGDESEEGDEDSEDDDDDQQSDESDDDEENSDKPDKKQKTIEKLEKRIDQLVGKSKSRENQLLQQIEDYKSNIEYLRKQVDLGLSGDLKDEFLKGLPEYNFNGKSIYALSDDEEDTAIASILDSDMATSEKQKSINALTRNRAKYKDRMDRQETQLEHAENEVWLAEWSLVGEQLKAVAPELEDMIPKIDAWIKNELDRKPYIKAKCVAGGPEAKADLTIKAIYALGLTKSISEEDLKKDRPDLKTPLGRSKTTSKGGKPSKPRSFTRDQISKMSIAEYEKHEKDIFAAAKAGRVK